MKGGNGVRDANGITHSPIGERAEVRDARANLTRRCGGAENVREVTIGGRLRFGGSTSSSTAGVLACQWNIAPLKISVQPGSRAYRPPKKPHALVREVHKVSIAAEASKNLLNAKSPLVLLVRGHPVRQRKQATLKDCDATKKHSGSRTKSATETRQPPKTSRT